MPKTLTDYRAKRDFKKTAEPSGQSTIRPAEHPRFVIQKHDATRLHYDLRLEVDGVFKSWAVTRGPSLDPKEKRLAVEVEDHPLDYGDFEGTIPKGQYGGGTVMLWDRGYWSPIGDKPAPQALEDGELKFNIAGDRMKGSWVLVRMQRDRTGGRRTNWLLIKHRDAWAKPDDDDKLLAGNRSVASGRTMQQIADGKGDVGPSPFMLSRRKAAPPDAIWNSRPKGEVPDRPEASPLKRASAKPPSIEKAGAGVPDKERVLGLKISNPDKVLWPAGSGDAVTKRQLVDYLADVGEWMIPHLRGRPCSLYRAPDGIEKEMFFQRHAGLGLSDLVKKIKISGDRQQYIKIDDGQALIAAGQMATVEFHPSNCAPDQVDVAGRLIFDLDPGPDVPFEAVIGSANEMRERVEALGLIAFCKTTGGKGLHVVTPLTTRATDQPNWEQAKTFAQTICSQMADDSPKRYLVNMAKKLRQGRIYLDYLRNDRLSSAVAPLSPRARPGATVSMPLTWRQVRAGLDPQKFTIKSVPPLLAKSKAWNDYDASAKSLQAAIKKLIGNAR